MLFMIFYDFVCAYYNKGHHNKIDLYFIQVSFPYKIYDDDVDACIVLYALYDHKIIIYAMLQFFHCYLFHEINSSYEINVHWKCCQLLSSFLLHNTRNMNAVCFIFICCEWIQIQSLFLENELRMEFWNV